ncbi:kanadaptin isoform X2 [Daphnia magna]|uniref:kanadaptin isoform X2 n=1 Tax=Daphnia magna TaxID=35525 RepID=UPI001E1BA7A3|nr:kanadaptin isoform X2 [Daphnia magna]
MDDVAEVFKCTERNTTNTPVFKKPVVVGKRPGVNISRPKSDTEQACGKNKNSSKQTLSSETSYVNADKETGSEVCVQKSESVIQIENNTSCSVQTKPLNLNYVVPSTSTVCPLPYMIEVLKDGVILQCEDIKTRKKPFLVFGRLPACDFVLQHPSISRYHAILQYKNENEKDGTGWFLFDLGSTHGTFLNKQQIPPKVYCRVHTGHVFRFGVSSRLFILQGPEEDQEAISELSVTELKELKLKRELALEKIDCEMSTEDNIGVLSASVPPSTSTGINWGMGEDAEDENPLAENPFSITDDVQVDENVYLDDPKKTLRGWFEREGYELEYRVEEKNYAHFICRVELPIDSTNGAPIVAEASVKGGKKKEAVVQCALEACRILDRHGLLRQAKHESKVRRRKRQYDEDYYSSDEDTFLDRTGAAERKRQARMKGQMSDVVETYESLSVKYKAVATEVLKTQQTLTQMNAQTRKPDKIDADDVDTYLEALQTYELSNKTSAAALRQKLVLLQKEELRLKTLLDIARPAIIDASKLPASNMVANQTKTVREASLRNQREGRVDSGKSYEKKSIPVAGDLKAHGVTLNSQDGVVTELHMSEIIQEPKEEKLKNEAGLSEVPGDSEKIGLVIRKRRKNKIGRNGPEWTETTKLSGNLNSHYGGSDDSKYDMWIPPEEQSGDGKNALNRKYGY